MKQVIVLKLEPTAEQHAALLLTMEAFNSGCNFVAGVAFKHQMPSKIKIQPLVYGELRSGRIKPKDSTDAGDRPILFFAAMCSIST